MEPLISFAIPLYNKAPYIASVIKSIHNLCSPLNNRYEICISDNASNDTKDGIEALLTSHGLYRNCRVSRLDHVISCQENWLYALAMCSAPIAKLQLADDKACQFDIKALLSLFDKQDIDYIIGKCFPTCSANRPDSKRFGIDYYEHANANRRKILDAPDKKTIVSTLLATKAFSGFSPLGDINGLVMRKACIDLLREPIYKSAFPPILCWPDWEIYMKIILAKKGAFLDQYVSEFHYNDMSPAMIALRDESFRLRVYEEPSATVRLSPFIHPDIRKQLLPHLSGVDKSRLLIQALTQILSDSGFSWSSFLAMAAKDRLTRAIINTAVGLKKLRNPLRRDKTA